MTFPTKPLGGKAYGSIGHLPQSRLGPGDWSIHEGQARICLEKPRKGDRIIVEEKLDGACMAVANIGGEIVALTRAGYRADSGRYEHLRLFGTYVREREADFRALLAPGERLCGEWLAMAHGATPSRGRARSVAGRRPTFSSSWLPPVSRRTSSLRPLTRKRRR